MGNIDLILKKISGWSSIDGITYEPLNGGLSNITYKVKVDNKFYVLRVNNNQNEYLDLSREEEQNAIIKASKLGIAPSVFSSGNKKNTLITEFIEGKSIEVEEMHNTELIKKVTSTLLKIHSLKGIKRVCSPFDLIRRYLKGAQDLSVIIPDNLHKHLKHMEGIEIQRSQDKENINKYCHNDYHTGYNMILNDEKLTVIDWELSGIGDVYFDLATISSDNRFSIEEDKVLLISYFGVFDNEKLTTLNDMKFVCMLREISWALMHEGMNIERINHDLKYYEFAQYILDRLDQGIVTL
ncbi:aminoglycoside phosphotransferase [Romboutsia weinsteinii]|uniref:Aminoglycoside phosphotransferase n=1 Tax=Romboutsia weinsteinii TaxID=2020949 RepID=A0A371J575_9FIRM|nr:choline/ethanolamine kinase family protein [Romboutsia weinsteinii]RDY27837.1 aminoglycoside phosphotransferase [Romboutsia weinsteinii]